MFLKGKITWCDLILQFYHPQNLRGDIANHTKTLNGHNFLKKIDVLMLQKSICSARIVSCSVCLPSIQIHISVTTGSNFLILSMMMGYGLGMMLNIFFLLSDIPDTQTKMSF